MPLMAVRVALGCTKLRTLRSYKKVLITPSSGKELQRIIPGRLSSHFEILSCTTLSDDPDSRRPPDEHGGCVDHRAVIVYSKGQALPKLKNSARRSIWGSVLVPPRSVLLLIIACSLFSGMGLEDVQSCVEVLQSVRLALPLQPPEVSEKRILATLDRLGSIELNIGNAPRPTS